MAVGRSRREKTSSCKSWRPSMRLQTHRRLRADAFGSTTEVSSCGITNYRGVFGLPSTASIFSIGRENFCRA